MGKRLFVGLAYFVCNSTFALNSDLIDSQVDLSTKIIVSVYEREAGSAQSKFTDFSIEVAPDEIAIGGGVEGELFPQGHLLTASYPNSALTAWLVSTKDHVAPHPAIIKAYAIGLKIKGLTRSQLKSHIQVYANTSATVAYPDTSVGVASGFKLVGGGFNVIWTGDGNIATASFPEGFKWRARSKQHIVPSPAKIRAYAIGIREFMPIEGLTRQILTKIGYVRSAYAQYPSSTANIDAGYVLSGCGARVNWQGEGNLLWQLVPSSVSSLHGCTASSKDHITYSPATVDTYAVGIQLR